MEEALRCLRDGFLPGRTPALVLIEDNLLAVGGPAVCAQLAGEICLAVSQQRAQANRVLLLPMSAHASAYGSTCQQHLRCHMRSSTIRADDSRALQDIAAAVMAPDCKEDAHVCVQPAPASGVGPEQHVTGSLHQLCIILDSLSSLLFLHPTNQVMQLMDELIECATVSCILATLHTDLHNAQVVGALERMASCVVRVLPSQAATSPTAEQPADLLLQALNKLRTGRVKVTTQHFRLLHDGALQEVHIDAASALPAALPAGAKGLEGDAAKDAGAQEALMQSMAGGMRLTLTQQEKAAREVVVLPWEQRQSGARSQDDFAVGGQARLDEALGVRGTKLEQTLGHINYDRDSETDPDSDEDPDDDLDF